VAKEITLTQGKVTVVDDEDYERLSQWKWLLHKGGYAARSVYRPGQNPKTIFLHHLILTPPPGMLVDHINGDKLDNRRANLRACNHAENIRNSRKRQDGSRTSPYKGVRYSAQWKSWQAYIRHDGKPCSLGSFTSEIAAAHAYNHAAKEFYGEFARLNDVPPMDNWDDYRVRGTSEYRGVFWDTQNGKWQSKIYHAGKTWYLGRFTSETDAALAYNRASIKIHGDKAKLNIIGKATTECA
jgi:hypothetical protein